MNKTEIQVVKVNDPIISKTILQGQAKLNQQKSTMKQEQQFQQLSNEEQFDNTNFQLLHKERQKRIEGIQINFFSDIQLLIETDCITDLKTQTNKDLITLHFPYIRRVRGDGNCLFSSLIFPLIEVLYCYDGFKQLIKEFQAYDIIWENKILITKHHSKIKIINLLEQFEKMREQNIDYNQFRCLLLHYANNVNGFYDLMIVMIRSLALRALEKFYKIEPFSNSISSSEYSNYKLRLSTFEVEGDYTTILLISEITQFKINFINFSTLQPLKFMDKIEPQINKTKQTQNVFTLKYSDGHYDILYSKLFKPLILPNQIFNEQLPILQFDQLF